MFAAGWATGANTHRLRVYTLDEAPMSTRSRMKKDGARTRPAAGSRNRAGMDQAPPHGGVVLRPHGQWLAPQRDPNPPMRLSIRHMRLRHEEHQTLYGRQQKRAISFPHRSNLRSND